MSRIRETAAVTATSRAQDQHNTSFSEENAFDAIAKEVCLELFCSGVID